MRLTIINQFYLPDLSPTARLAAAVAEHRAVQGDEVTVVASQGTYIDSQTSGRSIHGRARANNPCIYRTWTPPIGQVNLIRRCMTFALFTLLATVNMLRLKRQDVIIAMTTPPFIAWVAVLHKILHRRTKIILWSMDCYPEVAERAGTIKPGGIVSRLLRLQNRVLFRWVDHVVCLESEMRDLLRSHYNPNNGVLPASVIPNWESRSFATAVRECAPTNRTRLADRELVVLYSGNLGTGHQFDTVLETADALAAEPFRFIFGGGGSRMQAMENAANQRQLSNVEFRSYVPREVLPALLASADCSLITLRDSMLGVMSPSKLYTNLAAGLPIVYVGPEGSHVDQIIQQFSCGVSVRHGEVGRLRDFLLQLQGSPTFQQTLRNHALRAFDTACNDERSLAAFDAVIDTVRPGAVACDKVAKVIPADGHGDPPARKTAA